MAITVLGDAMPYVDLALLPDGELEFPVRLVRGADAVVQRIRFRFRFWRGEYHLDTRIGIPYRERILIANPDTILITAIFRRVLATTPGVKSVERFDAKLDKTTRTLAVTFAATLDSGATIQVTSEPFIIGDV